MSLRARLLLLLLLLFTVSWLAVGVATYFEAKHEIEELFDAQLSQVAGVLSALGDHRNADPTFSGSSLDRSVFGHRYEKLISFQIWNEGRLVLRSHSAPRNRMASLNGFSDVEVAGAKWRVFSMTAPNGNEVLTGENYAVRKELQDDIALSLQVPLAMAIPALMFLIWVGVGRSLEPLDQLASEVESRAPGQLEPVDNSRVPAEVKPLTLALNQLLQRVDQALDRERQFTADAAHELRTPLASIRTHAQVAQRSLVAEESAKALRNVVHGIDRSTRLVEQMLDMARLDPVLGRDRFDRIDIGSVVQGVLVDMAPEALDRDIELSLERAGTVGDQGCEILAYRPGIEVMLRNLVNNALQHTPGGGRVLVQVECRQTGVLLTITDTGPGIDATERLRVFDRFYRPAGSNRAGCGLGLAIVARAVELHHGQIQLLAPSEHTGLIVEIRLPAAEGQASSSEQESA